MEKPASSLIKHRKFQEGQSIGQYQIIRKIGVGGMGQVFEVLHTVLKTTHALKVISPDLADRPKALEYFEREARIMAGLQHPGIVQVDEFGLDAGHHWLRMELVPGLDSPDGLLLTLEDYRKFHGGVVPEHKVAGCLRQFLDAIGYAHQAGVIHRDLKPANILLSPEGMKIGDFGIARILPNDWEKTLQATHIQGQSEAATKAWMGTLAYMSPEQKRGQATQQSDLWSIALIAYQLLTGKDSPSPQPASQTYPGISTDWDDWFRKGLDADPGKRFKDATEMLAELPKPEKPSASPTRKPQTIPGLPATIIVLSLIVALLVVYLSKEKRVIKERPTTAQDQAISQSGKILGWPDASPTVDKVKIKPLSPEKNPVVKWVKGVTSSEFSIIQAAAHGKEETLHTLGNLSGNLGFHTFSKNATPLNGFTFPCTGTIQDAFLHPLEDGSCLLAAAFSGEIYANGRTFRAIGDTDIILAKTQPNGTVQWAYPLVGPGQDRPTGLHQFPDGTLFLGGNFEQEIEWQEEKTKGIGGKDFFILLLSQDSQGKAYIQSFGGIGDDQLTHIGTRHGRVHINGIFSGNLPLGKTRLRSKGLHDIFTAQILEDGTFHRTVGFGSELDDLPTAFTIASNGNRILAGNHTRPLDTLEKPVPTRRGKGQFLSSFGFQSYNKEIENIQIQSLVSLPGSSLYALANFRGKAKLDGHSWESMGKDDMLLLQFSRDGQLLGSNQFGGSGDDQGMSLSHHYEGGTHRLLLSGYCGPEAEFQGYFLRTEKAKSGFVCLVELE